jgi:hypothetical protein
MIDLLSTGKNKKNISIKYLLLTFFVCISMVAWLGISDLRADEDDSVDNTNDAQTQRLENVANEAALQEAALQEAALKDPDSSKDMDYYRGEIVAMRESGMGWGEIVHALNNTPYNLEIHNSVLGLGHSKISSEEVVQSSKHSSWQSGNNQGQGLALGHSKDNSSNRGGDHGGGNGGGKGGGNGGGKK